MEGRALKLLWIPLILLPGSCPEAEVGRSRGGEDCVEMSSALPSKDIDKRIEEAGVLALSSILSGHEAG